MDADLTLEHVSTTADNRRILNDVSLHVHRGEFVTLVGPNGAGKTSLFRAALGLLRIEGQALLGDKPVKSLSGRERAALAAWLPQQALVTEPVTVLEFVAGARFRFDESRGSALEAAAGALATCRAEACAPRFVNTLSGGEQQRVAMAVLLAQEAPLLLLDEPANHLDPGQQIALYRLIGELWRAGRSVLCITHDINLLAHLGATEGVRVVGMRDGGIGFELPLLSPALAKQLSELFGVTFSAVRHEGRTLMLPAEAP